MEYADVETKISLVILTGRDLRYVEYFLVNAGLHRGVQNLF